MKWKTKKTTWVVLYIKYSKFWRVSLEQFVERKPLISEEWGIRGEYSQICKTSVVDYWWMTFSDVFQSKYYYRCACKNNLHAFFHSCMYLVCLPQAMEQLIWIFLVSRKIAWHQRPVLDIKNSSPLNDKLSFLTSSKSPWCQAKPDELAKIFLVWRVKNHVKGK